MYTLMMTVIVIIRFPDFPDMLRLLYILRRHGVQIRLTKNVQKGNIIDTSVFEYCMGIMFDM